MKNTENTGVGQANNIRESSILKRRIIKHGELAVIDRERNGKSSAETYSTIMRRKKSEELLNNRDQSTKEDTRAHNSSTGKINRICRGKNKGIIAESGKKFRVELDMILKNKKALGLCEKQIIHGNEQDHLDKIWGIIERAIIEVANKSLLKKKSWWKIMKKRNSKVIENATNKEISRRIKERCEMISLNQRKMIASLLNKPYKKVKLNKLLEKEGLYIRLISNPKQVLDKTRAHFQEQFRQRRTNLSEEYRDWQDVYEPKTTIKEEWYKGLDEEILEEE
ncbi:6426_t:CDS:2 [Gigaspora rosea]|nr:6426_t:CDS:2 [Gigaspora rosea]